MSRIKHKNKDIEKALQYAEQNGWIVEVHNNSKSHAGGVIKCQQNSKKCWTSIYCITSIWSTPKNPYNHARQIIKIVDKCIYKRKKEDE